MAKVVGDLKLKSIKTGGRHAAQNASNKRKQMRLKDLQAAHSMGLKTATTAQDQALSAAASQPGRPPPRLRHRYKSSPTPATRTGIHTMIPFILPLTVTKGITFGPVTFLFKQADATPFDLTGYQVLAYARRYKNSKEKIDLDASRLPMPPMEQR